MSQTAVDVEIILNGSSRLEKEAAISAAKNFLLNRDNVKPFEVYNDFDENYSILYNDVEKIIIGDWNQHDNSFSQLEIKWYVYTVDTTGPIDQTEHNNDETLNIATHLILPSAELLNLWENLYFDKGVKENLLKYGEAIMELSEKGVDINKINCNRVILLHGPPGTGKTSLCKALAQKLTVKMLNRFDNGLLIEVNSHSLFSKWFSESGKLVNAMFSKITDYVKNSKLFVCLLIDEVESLAHARNQCLSGNEPSDSIRVVNAVLTQIDRIKRYPNVLILTTSNITESIDLAFIDRADVKQYLGLPTIQTIYQIYYSCLNELIRIKVIDAEGHQLPPRFDLLQEFCGDNEWTEKIQRLCNKSLGLSGRNLRKIPFTAYALYTEQSRKLPTFLDALEMAVDKEKSERKHFEKNGNDLITI